ncbi:hypothetical protein [Falsiroseomonas tokyonensis]|uniref:Uncharacterized protein n=1 Tax=Falsiroseomonas tokyonensis TaxID=430521 RepID=A0ABV7BPC1_9PROT|nr:hypothetical protein [Falsiroseomonas tokyonensis]MBU8537066.1 hypothetical protein [Falsiroseomonas tokyonensis]
MRPRDPPPRLPRFAPREPRPEAARPARTTVLDLVHKLLTAGAALATILRVLF